VQKVQYVDLYMSCYLCDFIKIAIIAGGISGVSQAIDTSSNNGDLSEIIDVT